MRPEPITPMVDSRRKPTSQYWNIVYGREAGEASLDKEGLQTMRALANNMAWLLKATDGKSAPGRDGEPAERTNFIR